MSNLVANRRREWALRLVSILIGLVAAVGIGEVATRILLRAPFRHDRLELCSPSLDLGADCYPEEAGTRFPVDLRRSTDYSSFRAQFPTLKLCASTMMPGRPGYDPDRVKYLRGISTDSGLAGVASSTPLCVTYDRTPLGDRNLVVPRSLPAASGACGLLSNCETIALLGDSFVWGQGISADETLTRQLADRLGVRVRSYAYSGADLPEVLGQFDQAMKEISEFGLSRIVYVFVLNDPYRHGDLHRRQERINNLMNLMHTAWGAEGRSGRWLDAVGERSRLVAVVEDRVAKTIMRGRTLSWYRDLLNPQVNPRLADSFDAIARMSTTAAWRGVEFDLVIYPLMVGFHPYPLQEAHINLRRLAAARDIRTLDLLPAFERQPAGERLVVHSIDYHPNGAAQVIAADTVAAFLRRSGASGPVQAGHDTVSTALIQQFPTVTRQPSRESLSLDEVRIGGTTKGAVLAKGAATRVTWPVSLPLNAWLKVSLGVREECWTLPNHGVRFGVGISRVGQYEEPLSIMLDPFAIANDRRWNDVALDLSRYAGQTVDIILNTRPASPNNWQEACAAWGAARVVVH